MNEAMNYLVVVFAVLMGSLHLVHRRMVRKIYDADGRSLSTFSLPYVIRREYAARYGMDSLYRYSQIMPPLVAGLILIASAIAFRK
jgi:hypothetical protein